VQKERTVKHDKPWKDWSDDELSDEADEGRRGQGAVVEATRRFRVSSDKYSRRLVVLTVILTVLTLIQAIAVVPVIKEWFRAAPPPAHWLAIEE
jgi:hypothetical protein